VVTTGVGACNKFAIEEFLSKFKADREPGDEEAELLPAEATELPLVAPANGEGAVCAIGAALVEMTPERGPAADLAMGTVAGGIVLLAVSDVVCMTCPAAMPDVSAPGTVWEGGAGAVIVAMAGCLVNVR
jgi:hypothetical protein